MSTDTGPQRKKKPKVKEPIWLLSFSDMTLIMLSFFLLIISTMSPNPQKMETVKEGLSKELMEKLNSLKKVSEELKRLIKQEKLEDKAKLEFDAQGIHLEFKDGMMFETGSAVLSTKFYATTENVLKVFRTLNGDYHITVEGHTDDLPIHSEQFDSNWNLSATRAVSVLKAFQQLGVPESRLSIQAYAHTKPKIPYQGLNGTRLQQARQANRRVVILIE